MKRSIPELNFPDVTVVKWPKTVFPIFVTVLFSLVLTVVLPFMIRAYSNNELPGGSTESLITIGLIALFYLVSLGGAYSSIRNYFNPYKQIIVNHEGMFFNIFLKGDDLFFVPWDSIVSVKCEKKVRKSGKHSQILDCLFVYFETSPEYILPSLIRSAGSSTKSDLYYYSDTIDFPITDILRKIKEIRPEKVSSPACPES
ncbi:MAG: hypothetical protein R2741_10675 [Methanolobus sp.]